MWAYFKMENKMIQIILTISAIILFVALIYLGNYLYIKNNMKKLSVGNINIEGDVFYFDSLTLKQKLAQMIMVKGDRYDEDYVKLNIGGIYLNNQKSIEGFRENIKEYKENSKIKLFVVTDLEGYWNPFKNFKEEYNFPSFSEIKTKQEAEKLGKEHGEVLKEIGFNINFAPVAEFKDEAYGGRVFPGTKEEIQEKLKSYIKGLQTNILGTCKHYPGKGMIKNTHLVRDKQEITKEDLELFDTCFKANISAIMIGHQIVTGELDSKGKPSSVSKEVIDSLENFEGLIIGDGIAMAGLRSFYPSKTKMYVDLINAGENIILDWPTTPTNIYKLLINLEKEVRKGNLKEEEIDKSVKKILVAKGYKIKIS